MIKSKFNKTSINYLQVKVYFKVNPKWKINCYYCSIVCYYYISSSFLEYPKEAFSVFLIFIFGSSFWALEG